MKTTVEKTNMMAFTARPRKIRLGSTIRVRMVAKRLEELALSILMYPLLKRLGLTVQ